MFAAHARSTVRIARRYGIKRAAIYTRAARPRSVAMREWQEFLDQYVPEPMRDAMTLRFMLPYMRQYFTPAMRSALLRDHIRIMAQHFMMDARLMSEPGMVITTLIGKNDARYTLHLGGNTSKEGEMAFGIYDASGHYMAKMACSIGQDERGARVLWIGGLQGAKPPLGRDEVVKATRDLYGLRPKGAVMLAAQTVARMLGATALRAPGNEGHISQRGFRRLRSKRKIYADYGQFWEEIGGVPHATVSDEYTIPVISPVRDIGEVKPNKRSEWKSVRPSVTR